MRKRRDNLSELPILSRNSVPGQSLGNPSAGFSNTLSRIGLGIWRAQFLIVMVDTKTRKEQQVKPPGGMEWHIVDHRREPRFVCRGDVRITVESPRREVDGDLVDISNHGFRTSYLGEALKCGTEIYFSHRFFRGRAKVMWSREEDDHNESGFMVVRD